MHARWWPQAETAWYFAAERVYMEQMDEQAQHQEVLRARAEAARMRGNNAAPTPQSHPPLGGRRR